MSEKVLLWHWGRRGAGPLYTLELGRALRRRGVPVQISFSRQAGLFPRAEAEGLTGFCPDTYDTVMSAAASLIRVPTLRRHFGQWLEGERIQTVISTMPSLWTPAMLSVAASGNRRYLPVIHDAVTHKGEHHPFRRASQARELEYADMAVVLSSHVARDVTRIYGYPYQRIAIIPLGVLEYGARRTPRQFPEGRSFRFLMFGRLLPYKGLDLLAEAVSLLPPELDIEILVAGSGPASPALAELGNHNKVTLRHHWIADEEMADLLNQSDAVLAPYREASQSGIITTAYRAALPAVATPVGGLIEQIEPYGAGLVAADHSPRAFARAMTKLARDRAFYEQCSAAAAAAANGPLSWDQIAAAFAELLERPEGRR